MTNLRKQAQSFVSQFSGLKMLPSACGLGQHFQDLGHSFSLYGPTLSRTITYIHYITHLQYIGSSQSSRAVSRTRRCLKQQGRSNVKIVKFIFALHLETLVCVLSQQRQFNFLTVNSLWEDTIVRRFLVPRPDISP